MNYYLADPHFDHRGILKSCHRPFDTVDAMNRTLITNWQARVQGLTDTVYILGDLFAYCKRPEPILSQLRGHGRLVLIEGNHDPLWLRKIDPADYFDLVCPELDILDRGRPVHMTHIPDPAQYPTEGYLLYGHIHNTVETGPLWAQLRALDRALNVGVDLALETGTFFGPATLEEWIACNERFRALHP